MLFTRRTAMLAGASTLLLPAACKYIRRQTIQANDLIPVFGSNTGSANYSTEDVQDRYIEQLGKGFDSVIGQMKALLVDGEQIEPTISPVQDDTANKFKYFLVEDQQSYYSLIQTAANAKAKFGSLSAKGSFSSSNEYSTSSYCLHVCALARRYGKAVSFDSRKLKLSHVYRNAMKVTGGNKAQMLKTFGDQYVAAVVPGDTLFVDLQFNTTSMKSKNDLKASISANYGALASGSGSISKLVREASGHKAISLLMVGLDGTMVPHEYTAAEIENNVKLFFERKDPKYTAAFMRYDPVDQIFADNGHPNWVNNVDVERRRTFFERANDAYEYLEQVHSDANYVAKNPAEFDEGVARQAAKDFTRSGDLMDRISADVRMTNAKFADTGVTDPAFNKDLRTLLKSPFQTYPQKEPPSAPSAPAPRPRKYKFCDTMADVLSPEEKAVCDAG
jgi:hypothetical protein